MENKMIVASPRAGGNLTLNVDALGRPEPGSRSVRDPNDSADPECILAVMPEEEPLSPSQHGISFDEALTKYVGEFGKGQWLIYLYACLLQLPNAVLILLLVFAIGTPIASKSWSCTEAEDTYCSSLLANPDPVAVKEGFCTMDRSQWAWTTPGQQLVTQYNLICADAWKAQLANTFFFVGYLIGSGICGVVADAYGRKLMTFTATALGAAFTAIALGATNYWALLILRLLTGVGVAGQALGSFLLATEMIGPSLRGIAGILTQVFFVFGEFALVIIGVSFDSWRSQFAAAAVFAACPLLLWPLIPESGRWLYVQGHSEPALQVLSKLARQNNSREPAEPLTPIDNSAGPEAGGKKVSVLSSLKNFHIARRFFILAFAWMVMCMVYYGISFAVGSLGSSLVVSFSIAAAAELPAYFLAAWAIENWGRHNTMAGGLLIGGAACLACAFAPAGTGKAVLAAVGKFGIAASFGTASVYTSELFPTLIRSAVLGYQNQAARIGGIIAPFIVMAGTAAGSGKASAVPFLVFGVAGLLAGLLVFTLPETLGVPLPDTIQDMENIASVFTHKTWQTKGLNAAAKSMFKTHVRFQKKPRTAKSKKLPAVLESGSDHRSESSSEPASAYVSRGNLIAGNSKKALLLSGDGSENGSEEANISSGAHV